MNLETLIAETVKQAVADAIAPLLNAQRPAARLSYTIPEAAALTGASDYDIRRAITGGKLTARQAGEGKTGKYIIPADCLHAWSHGLQQPALKKVR